MVEPSAEGGMVGSFWIVENGGKPTVIALAVPLGRADTYGDMLTVDIRLPCSMAVAPRVYSPAT
jgi:hypothetical protein